MVRAEPRHGDNGDARVVTESFLRPLDSAPLKRARQIETETETDRERERDTEQDRQRDSDCDGQTWRQTAVGPRWAAGRAVLTNGHTGHLPRAPGFFVLFEKPPTGCGEIHF